MLSECVSEKTAVCVTAKVTGIDMYGTYRRHDGKTITIYGMVCGGANGDEMKEKTFNLADVVVNVIGKLRSRV